LAKKTTILIPLIVLLFCCCSAREKWHTSTVIYFDTVCEIKIFGSSPQFRSSMEAVHGVFSKIETLFSPDSCELTSPEVLNLFRRALEIHKISGGAFDISIAPILKLWGFYERDYRVPSPGEIRRSLNRVGMTKIEAGEFEIRLPAGMEIDWGGIAKGYGIDLAAQTLRDLGILRGFINAGGDLYCWGSNPGDAAWKIGIKHPRQEGFLGVLSLTDEGAATTGDYQRFFIREGVRYHHVFDPQSGYPAHGKQSVTVAGPETTICDALATAVFISKQPDSILDFYPEYGAFIVDTEGRLSRAGREFTLRIYE